MSAGTLTLTNKSAAVTGSGTTFTTELAAGDFAVVTVGGIPYSLPVKSVESNTSLTLVSNFTGPSQAGAAWYAVPRVAMNLVTAAVVTQSAEALRGINYDKQNWQQFFTATGDVTITLPDTSQTTGPSAKKLMSSVEAKADATDPRLDTINGKSGGQINSGVNLAWGTDGVFSHSMAFDVIPGQEAARLRGSRADFVDGTNRVILNLDSVGGRKTTFYPSGGVICKAGIDAEYPTLNSYFISYAWGDIGLWIDSTRMGAIQLTNTSDKLLKKEIAYVKGVSALDEVMQWRPATFKFKKRGIIPEGETQLGFIANDLVELSPECVKGRGLEEGFDENNAADAYSLDETAMIAKLTLSIQELQKQITDLQERRV